ncbi:MAG TPA: phosphatidylserine/phosphatidylglycerophosphate/cardiolipin synthase family protein [Woeseiaceae bacterium]|nr:phosphatidylserine/phosphatidylglycerophosphate/cardiolipin synthase family protein [Woeseiaceae bacterium]
MNYLTNHASANCCTRIPCAIVMAIILAGCAGSYSKILSEAGDQDAATAAILASDPVDTGRGNHLGRRSAGIAQAGILYARSFHIDPLNRPVSNLLSLSSVALKSASGLARRFAIGTVAFPSLESQPIPELAHAQGMDLDQWEQDLDRISGQKREQGTIEFLVDGEEYFTRLMSSIETARESIDIRTYIFDNDDYAVEVADFLKSRSEDIRIRVMIDGLGNLLATQADPQSAPGQHEGPVSMELYLEQGSKIAVRSRANPWLTGDHTKTTIVDRKIAFVGGMNIGREYRYEWHDLMMQVTGPVVDRLQHDSDKAWARAGVLGDLGNLFRFLSGKKRHAGDEGYAIRPLYTRSFDSQIYRAQLEAIRRSRDYILIENAYFSDDATLYELARARRRGVDVRVILPTSGNHGPMNASNQVAINRMLENGIRVYMYPGMSHVKAAIFDGWACVGSANFDKLSLEVNKELNLATSEPSVVNELLERVFLPDMAVSTEIDEPLEVTMQAQLFEFAADELL